MASIEVMAAPSTAPDIEQLTARIHREELAQYVIKGINTIACKLSELEGNIRELWTEFENLPKGETIMGCSTKKEFCEKHLHRTPRAIQYLLNGGNAANMAERRENISLPDEEPKPITNVNFNRRADVQASNAIIEEAKATLVRAYQQEQTEAKMKQRADWRALSPERRREWLANNLWAVHLPEYAIEAEPITDAINFPDTDLPTAVTRPEAAQPKAEFYQLKALFKGTGVSLRCSEKGILYDLVGLKTMQIKKIAKVLK